MEFKKIGFYQPEIVEQPTMVTINGENEIIQKIQENFDKSIKEFNDTKFREVLGLDSSPKIDFKDELSKMIDKLTQLILVNISDEDFVKKAIEDLGKECNITYITSPYIPQGQILLIEDENLKHQILKSKREYDKKKGLKQDAE